MKWRIKIGMAKSMKANIIHIYNYKLGPAATSTCKQPYWSQGEFFTTLKCLHSSKHKSNVSIWK